MAGLGLPTSGPTAQELQAGQQLDMIGSPATDQAGSPAAGPEQVQAALQQQQAAATPDGRAAIQAALHGSFGEEQAAEPGGQVRACVLVTSSVRSSPERRVGKLRTAVSQHLTCTALEPPANLVCRPLRAESWRSRHSRRSTYRKARLALPLGLLSTTRLPTWQAARNEC